MPLRSGSRNVDTSRRTQPTKTSTRQKPTSARKTVAERKKPGKRGTALTNKLQEEAFLLNVMEGLSCREIAERMGIDKDTAAKYIRVETERRAKELGGERDKHTARAVAFYSTVAAKAVKLADKADAAFMQPLVKGLDSAIHARERIDKLLGLDAPTKIDMGLQSLIDALGAGDDRARPLE